MYRQLLLLDLGAGHELWARWKREREQGVEDTKRVEVKGCDEVQHKAVSNYAAQ